MYSEPRAAKYLFVNVNVLELTKLKADKAVCCNKTKMMSYPIVNIFYLLFIK